MGLFPDHLDSADRFAFAFHLGLEPKIPVQSTRLETFIFTWLLSYLCSVAAEMKPEIIKWFCTKA